MDETELRALVEEFVEGLNVAVELVLEPNDGFERWVIRFRPRAFDYLCAFPWRPKQGETTSELAQRIELTIREMTVDIFSGRYPVRDAGA